MRISASPTGLKNFGHCQAMWNALKSGKKKKGRQLRLGNAAHKAAWAISRLAWRSETEGGIGPDDVELVIRRYARRFETFGSFKAVSAGLRKHAERVNARRMSIAGLERMIEIVIPVGKDKVVLRGILDEFNLDPETKEWGIHELKTYGQIPSEDDLSADLQTSHYAALVREWATVKGHRYHGPVWKNWYSIVHGAGVQVAADEADAKAAKDYALGVASKMLAAVKTGKFTETTGADCDGCPRSTYCKAWAAEGKELGIPASVTTIDAYVRARGREAAWGGVKERIKPILTSRVESVGGVLTENGCKAEVRYSQGGLNEKYLKMTRAQLLAALATGPSTRLLVKETR